MSTTAAESGKSADRNSVRVVQQGNDTLCLQLEGDWSIQRNSADAISALQLLQDDKISSVVFDSRELTGWDSALITFLLKVLDRCKQRTITADTSGLPSGVQRLLGLATAITERSGARKTATHEPFLSRVGAQTIALYEAVLDTVCFSRRGDCRVRAACNRTGPFPDG